MKKIIPLRVHIYKTANGQLPFYDWFNDKLDNNTYSVISKRLTRVEQGNLGDIKSLGKGLFELRIHSGPGYRIYFGWDQSDRIILLLGGFKRDQKRDIKRALKYWNNWRF